jgi:6-phosphogluconolactonase (cycloisomerase 2 family)
LGLTIDPRGQFLYVANYTSGSVSAYAINTASGTPVGSVGSASTQVDTGPMCVTVDPALGIYLFSANNLAGTVSALQLNPNNGGLNQVQNTPFPSNGLPTCAVSVANGSHPSQIIVQ